MSVREKILIVDDNPTNIEILQEYLEDNYDLEIASSGTEALDKAATFQPAIILLDIMMPGMDGYEVCKRIRATPSLAHIKIIILSVKAMLSERLKATRREPTTTLPSPSRKKSCWPRCGCICG
ncbi:MAG: response regulator [Candidatus Competibacteraceae bacterium]